MDVFDRLIELLEDAEKAATMENASFGFPNDRIEVKSVHFGDDRNGRVGDVLHPTEYVKSITKLHHGSWIISPIRQARELLKLHSDIIKDAANLRTALEKSDLRKVIEQAEILSEKARAGLRD